jgi:hypothetical protein
MPKNHHQPSLAADLFGLWRLPYEIAAECSLAAAEVIAGSLVRHKPHATQLPIPEPIEADGERNLFA